MVSRRRALERVAAVAGAVGLSGCQWLGSAGTGGVEGLPPNPRADALPVRQFAQNDHLPTDDAGNTVQPRFRRVLALRLDVDPSAEAARTVERAMRTVEAAYGWSARGLFHALGWGTAYFERVGALGRAPVTRPRVLSRTDDPELRAFDAVLVLASDVPSHLSAVDAAMFGSRSSLGGVAVDDRLGDAFAVASRRTGFLGEGLPASHADTEGVPDAIPADAPMFTGFFSDRRGTQATEDAVAIADGPFEDGTTMHVSRLDLDLDAWYALSESDRVARMFSPAVSSADVEGFENAVPFADRVREHAREYGVVGHHEKVAQTRRDGTPLLLRRDFNTLDGGVPGVHFVSLQRRLSHFRETRKAMNGWYVRDDHPRITDRENNGLLGFVTVRSRANFYVPPRDCRAFPLR
ncbi:hypothetical protein ACFQJD_13660 [Haloplanus sp. GCM10025708]|uniref:DUF7405 family protein n=1 Tax=Haloplanus sp. GCM10025708 TaxID=3252679 RepID=UPI003617284F